MKDTTLYLYEFDTSDFELQDEIAGYYISKAPQVPIAKHKVIDVFSELMARNVEIRVVDNLWDTQTKELADEICADCETDAEKAQSFHNWIVDSFEYDFEAYPFIQYFYVNKTIRTRKGLCFDFAHLFAAFCRSQNIPCHVIDGMSYTDYTDCHTWNRVFYDGTWWDVDITCDIERTQKKQELYSFRALESVSAPDKYFCITKIY